MTRGAIEELTLVRSTRPHRRSEALSLASSYKSLIPSGRNGRRICQPTPAFPTPDPAVKPDLSTMSGWPLYFLCLTLTHERGRFSFPSAGRLVRPLPLDR